MWILISRTHGHQRTLTKIHTMLTDNGQHFTTPGNRCSAIAEIKLALLHLNSSALRPSSSRAIADIDHRLTRPKHP